MIVHDSTRGGLLIAFGCHSLCGSFTADYVGHFIFRTQGAGFSVAPQILTIG